jgi:polysaccharide deacetylase family protein (PEP-CTERM system associated)
MTEPAPLSGVTHRLTVDVEDWFHAEAQSVAVPRDAWDIQRLRVLPNVLAILDLFAEFRVQATFFFLGWLAERLPDMVRLVAESGHEIACHSYYHRLIYSMPPQEFAADTRRAKERLEKAAGVEVKGYRAPSFSVVPRSAWALTELARAGFAYDSSVFPVRHDTYGWPSAPKRPFRVNTPEGSIVEFPLTTAKLWGQTVPAAGGGYLRLFPLSFTQRVLRAHTAAREEAIVYFHPWEIDPRQPRSTVRGLRRFRHYTNLDRMMPKLRALLGEFSFGPLIDSSVWQTGAPTFNLDERLKAGIAHPE